ncbi:hypothetical protein O181_065765 [Austropuccinia psidii MF-1]|uniref:Uncharacterized protein n=1 Tax=Austropuccinia psidii MF-1 TaxID=1389203 RepID=A0A9Q3EMS9_9BASI|nr:hypothetical protein [Austropuccinia psidii MF-1]
MKEFPTENSGNIPVSVQELVYGGKISGVGTSTKPLDRDNELLFSSKEALRPRKGRGSSEGLETHVLQRKSPKDKSFVEKPKHFFRGSEGRVGPKGQKPSRSSSSLHKCKTRACKPQSEIRRARKRQRGRKIPSGTSLTLRATEFQRGKRHQCTMCSIWQECLWNSKSRRRKE